MNEPSDKTSHPDDIAYSFPSNTHILAHFISPSNKPRTSSFQISRLEPRETRIRAVCALPPHIGTLSRARVQPRSRNNIKITFLPHPTRPTHFGSKACTNTRLSPSHSLMVAFPASNSEGPHTRRICLHLSHPNRVDRVRYL